MYQFPTRTSEEWRTLAKRHLATTTIHSEFVPLTGEGVYITNPEGRVLIDFASFVGVCNLGHGSAINAIVDEVRAYEDATRLRHRMTNDWTNPWAVELAMLLEAVTPGNQPKKVFFSTSGTEANEAAIKLLLAARPNRPYFLACLGAFHGRTGNSNALMGAGYVRVRDYPRPFHTFFIPFPRATDAYPTPASYMQRVEENDFLRAGINGLIIELVQGEGGIYSANPEFLGALVEYCWENDIKIIVDEVQTGFGRTGTLFACEHYGFSPDIFTFAKSICSGIHSLGATVFDAELDFDELGRHSNTNGGNGSACVAAMKTIELTRNYLASAEAQKNQPFLRRRLETAANTLELRGRKTRLSNVRGLGWMLGADVCAQDIAGNYVPSAQMRDRVVACAEQNGLILIGCGKAAIRFMPPIIITTEEIEKAMVIFENLPVWD